MVNFRPLNASLEDYSATIGMSSTNNPNSRFSDLVICVEPKHVRQISFFFELTLEQKMSYAENHAGRAIRSCFLYFPESDPEANAVNLKKREPEGILSWPKTLAQEFLYLCCDAHLKMGGQLLTGLTKDIYNIINKSIDPAKNIHEQIKFVKIITSTALKTQDPGLKYFYWKFFIDSSESTLKNFRKTNLLKKISNFCLATGKFPKPDQLESGKDFDRTML